METAFKRFWLTESAKSYIIGILNRLVWGSLCQPGAHPESIGRHHGNSVRGVKSSKRSHRKCVTRSRVNYIKRWTILHVFINDYTRNWLVVRLYHDAMCKRKTYGQDQLCGYVIIHEIIPLEQAYTLGSIQKRELDLYIVRAFVLFPYPILSGIDKSNGDSLYIRWGPCQLAY